MNTPSRAYTQFTAGYRRFQAVSEWHLEVIKSVREHGLEMALAIENETKKPNEGKGDIRRRAQALVRRVKKADKITVATFWWNGLCWGITPDMTGGYTHIALCGKQEKPYTTKEFQDAVKKANE